MASDTASEGHVRKLLIQVPVYRPDAGGRGIMVRLGFGFPQELSKAGVCSELGGHRLCSFQFFGTISLFPFLSARLESEMALL